MSDRTDRESARTLATVPSPLSLLPSAGNGPPVSDGVSAPPPVAAVVDADAATVVDELVDDPPVVVVVVLAPVAESSLPHAASTVPPTTAAAVLKKARRCNVGVGSEVMARTVRAAPVVDVSDV